MLLKNVMAELNKHGTAQNRKVYTRHGVKGEAFGVSYANLGTMAKKIKTNHDLAVQLWETDNHDARILATMIADPERTDTKLRDRWLREVDSYVLGDAVSEFFGNVELARKCADKWSQSTNDFTGQIGWNLICGKAMHSDGGDDAYFSGCLETIECEIHTRKNRTRHAMNMALCGIGIGCESLREQAVATAQRIGQISVDHGETGCKTPNAAEYIQRAASRKKKRSK